MSEECLKLKYCASCGRVMGDGARFCPHCGHDYEPGLAVEPRSKGADLAGVGGVLLILSAVVSCIAIPFLLDASSGSEPHASAILVHVHDFILALSAVTIIFGVVTVVGGVFALKRASFALALMGGLLSVFGMGMVLGLAGLLCIVSSKASFGRYGPAEIGWPSPPIIQPRRGSESSLDTKIGARRR